VRSIRAVLVGAEVASDSRPATTFVRQSGYLETAFPAMRLIPLTALFLDLLPTAKLDLWAET
jgi:hypothetical protein